MKRVFLGLISLVAFFVFAAVVYVWQFLPLQKPAADILVTATEDKIARGRYLAVNVLQCIDCHSERDWTLYGGPPKAPIGAGRACMDLNTRPAGVNAGQDSFPGKLCIRNITPDIETGIGEWTDGEIIRAVREGINRNGEGLFPIMPYFIYSNVADEDVEALVAYLRTMDPVSSVRPERQIDFPLFMLTKMLPKPLSAPVLKPDSSDSVGYGKYLATIARCAFCHTPKDPNSMDAYPGREFAGGMPFFLNGRTMFSMNLTPHESDLGSWSRKQFVQLFKSRANPVPVEPTKNTLMNWGAFGDMTEDDLGAMYDFFMTLPPVAFEKEPT
jgi:mono/diheme cytochrome c family protein